MRCHPNLSATGESSPGVAHTRRNQRDRIFELLASGCEVSSVDLAAISLQYSARIFELRSLGHRIVSRVVLQDGKRHGFFHLVKPVPTQANLFGPIEMRVRWIDPEEA